jgi:hypothetical protein
LHALIDIVLHVSVIENAALIARSASTIAANEARIVSAAAAQAATS